MRAMVRGYKRAMCVEENCVLSHVDVPHTQVRSPWACMNEPAASDASEAILRCVP
jgi:hypothetical protein